MNINSEELLEISEAAKALDEHIKGYFRQLVKQLLEDAVRRESERITGSPGVMLATLVAYIGPFLFPSELTREIACRAYEQREKDKNKASQLGQLTALIKERVDSMDIESLSPLLKSLVDHEPLEKILAM